MQVTINSDYFAKSLNDYSNWKWAWGRELYQNSIDCKSKTIKFTISYNGQDTIAECENDGAPMDYDTLINKFMSIGATTKESTQNVGGFGLAKTVIALAHKSYAIYSGEHSVIGSGGSFECEVIPFFNGTKTVITMTGDQTDQLIRNIRLLASYAQWDGKLILNGEELSTKCYKGHFRRSFDFGNLYTTKNFKNKLVFRINGIPMFSEYIDYEHGVIFESTKSSVDILTSNRDSLRYTYQSQINEVIRAFTVNRESILNNEPVVTLFGNTMLKVTKKEQEIVTAGYSNTPKPQSNDSTIVSTPETERPSIGNTIVDEKESVAYVCDVDDDKTDVNTKDHTEESQAAKTTASTAKAPTMRFAIYNSTSMKVPTAAHPATMSAYCQKLSTIWAKLIIELHKIDNNYQSFAIGFTLGEREAQYIERSGHKYYLINPFNIVIQKESKSRSFAKKWKFTDKENIIMCAVHEYAHSFHHYHDESYANRLTELSALAMKNLQTLKKCFKD